MPFKIEDGTGHGHVAEVTQENQLKVSSSSSTVEHYVNHVQGRAYTLSVDVTAGTNDACVCYIKNTNDIYDLVIEGLWIYVSDACEVYTKINDTGTPGSTTNVTPINLNTRSGISAVGNFYYGENITGLSGGNEVWRLKFTAETATKYFNYDQDIILGNNGVHTVYVKPSGIRMCIMIPFNFHGKHD